LHLQHRRLFVVLVLMDGDVGPSAAAAALEAGTVPAAVLLTQGDAHGDAPGDTQGALTEAYVAEMVRLRDDLRAATARGAAPKGRRPRGGTSSRASGRGGGSGASSSGGSGGGKGEWLHVRKRTGGALSVRTVRNLRYDLAAFLQERFDTEDVAAKASPALPAPSPRPGVASAVRLS
jgi:hypothetical protein